MTTTMSTSEKEGTSWMLQDEPAVPATFLDALDWDDPVAALRGLATHSQAQADTDSAALSETLKSLEFNQVPEGLRVKNETELLNSDHPVAAAAACADSIVNSLVKIASGGSEASRDIRALEDAKRQTDAQANAVALALQFRKSSQQALQGQQARSWTTAAQQIRPWLLWKLDDKKQQDDEDDVLFRRMVAAYAGPYCLQQLEQVYDGVKDAVLDLYQTAVAASNLQALGQLTPVLSDLELAPQAVQLYLQFLQGTLPETLKQTATPNDQQPQEAPFQVQARVYNAAVQCLRHHLPMVSHFLHQAQGDVAVVQLVHVQTEQHVLPLLEQYRRSKQLDRVATTASQIATALEDRYTGRQPGVGGDGEEENATDESEDDAGFARRIGSLSDVDAAMEEVAITLQQAESYLRFVTHTCDQIRQARHLRFVRAQQEARVERERRRNSQEWKARGKQGEGLGGLDEEEDEKEEELEILPASTPLHLTVAEVGGLYASIEHGLLLASLHRALSSNPDDDDNDNGTRFYRPLTLPQLPSSRGGASHALQTCMVETCFYATRRAAQRALATGHTGTASAMTNFAVDCLQGVVLEVLSYRAEDVGVSLLKPGEGLLVGSAGIFNNASNLIRQGTHVGTAVVAGGTSQQQQHKDRVLRQQEIEHGVARACAVLNDLEVAVHQTKQFESLLSDTIAKGFPPNQHATEQLQMCVKSLSNVTDSFQTASDSTIESLVSVLKPRLRSIVGEAIGGEGAALGTGAFMGTSVMGGKTHEKVTVRMNYDLNEESYQMLQLSEGYVAHMCTLMDELLVPVRSHLAPRLWDVLLLGVMGAVCKRLETSLRKCHFTGLGALTFDSDMRDLLHYTKDRLHSGDLNSSNVSKLCPPLGRLLQVSKLLNVDDLEDVIDLIGSSKRKGNWALKLDDAKDYLSLRVEFEESKVKELLRDKPIGQDGS